MGDFRRAAFKTAFVASAINRGTSALLSQNAISFDVAGSSTSVLRSAVVRIGYQADSRERVGLRSEPRAKLLPGLGAQLSHDGRDRFGNRIFSSGRGSGIIRDLEDGLTTQWLLGSKSDDHAIVVQEHPLNITGMDTIGRRVDHRTMLYIDHRMRDIAPCRLPDDTTRLVRS